MPIVLRIDFATLGWLDAFVSTLSLTIVNALHRRRHARVIALGQVWHPAIRRTQQRSGTYCDPHGSDAPPRMRI